MVELTPEQKTQLMFPEVRDIRTFRLLMKRYLNNTFKFYFTDRAVKLVTFPKKLRLEIGEYQYYIPLDASIEEINSIIEDALLRMEHYKGFKPEQLYRESV